LHKPQKKQTRNACVPRCCCLSHNNRILPGATCVLVPGACFRVGVGFGAQEPNNLVMLGATSPGVTWVVRLSKLDMCQLERGACRCWLQPFPPHSTVTTPASLTLLHQPPRFDFLHCLSTFAFAVVLWVYSSSLPSASFPVECRFIAFCLLPISYLCLLVRSCARAACCLPGLSFKLSHKLFMHVFERECERAPWLCSDSAMSRM
jgi:hypothetical protein